MVLDIKSVLVLDSVGTKCTEILIAHGLRVTKLWAVTERELIELIPAYDALVVQSATKVTRDVFRAAKNLKVVVCAGAYFNNVDIIAAFSRGVGVVNSPRSGVTSACEFSCGLLMVLARHLIAATAMYRAGVWDRTLFTGSELSGSTLALIGLGDVAREVALHMNAFGMKVIGCDNSLTTAQCKKFCVQKKKLNEIWPVADYIILFTPPFAPVRTYITADHLKLCKGGVKVIIMGNIGRYQVCQLYNGIMSGHIGGVAFDMYEETKGRDYLKLSLLRHPAVIITKYLALQTEECIERGGQEAAEQLVNLCKPGTFDTPLSTIMPKDGM